MKNSFKDRTIAQVLLLTLLVPLLAACAPAPSTPAAPAPPMTADTPQPAPASDADAEAMQSDSFRIDVARGGPPLDDKAEQRTQGLLTQIEGVEWKREYHMRGRGVHAILKIGCGAPTGFEPAARLSRAHPSSTSRHGQSLPRDGAMGHSATAPATCRNRAIPVQQA